MKTILCVDDIEANLYTLEAIILQHREKYKVITASSGQEALLILLQTKIDMILLDVMMPEMDGFETAKFILRNKKTKNIPIIFVTAKKDDETISQCYRVGGVDYLNKPYSEIELFARISFHFQLLEKQEKLEQERNFAQKILDTQENIILVTDGIKVQKVNKSLLDFFQVSSREMFIEKYRCLSLLFEKEEECFYLKTADMQWLEHLYELLKVSQQIVAIKEPEQQKLMFFSIDVTPLDGNYLVALTDITELNEASRAFKFDAFHDTLTGIYNRQRFDMVLKSKLIAKRAFGFIIFDIDHFKKINDEYGHLVGDSVLKELTKEVESTVRQNDVFARWGGEEFVIILEGVESRSILEAISEHIRKHIQKHSFAQVGYLTCSFGSTVYRQGDKEADIIQRADQALYKAKEEGRNRVCIVM